MKRYIVIYLFSFFCAFVLACLALWALQGHLIGSARELVKTGAALVFVGFAFLS